MIVKNFIIIPYLAIDVKRENGKPGTFLRRALCRIKRT